MPGAVYYFVLFCCFNNSTSTISIILLNDPRKSGCVDEKRPLIVTCRKMINHRHEPSKWFVGDHFNADEEAIAY